LAEQLRPDVVLLALRMKDSHGLNAMTASPKPHVYRRWWVPKLPH